MEGFAEINKYYPTAKYSIMQYIQLCIFHTHRAYSVLCWYLQLSMSGSAGGGRYGNIFVLQKLKCKGPTISTIYELSQFEGSNISVIYYMQHTMND